MRYFSTIFVSDIKIYSPVEKRHLNIQPVVCLLNAPLAVEFFKVHLGGGALASLQLELSALVMVKKACFSTSLFQFSRWY